MRHPLALLVLLGACAGRSEKSRPASEAAPSSGGEAGSGTETVAPTGGAAGDSPDASPGQGGNSTLDDTQGGVSAQGGDSPTSSKIGSGTRYCDNYLECFELDCVAPVLGLRTACIASCQADSDCRPDEVCLRSADLEPGCYERCDFSVGCYNGFDCFDFSKTHETPVCFPTSWASYWQAHRL